MPYKVQVSDDVGSILLRMAGEMKVPSDLTSAERIELALEGLVLSFDTTQDVELEVKEVGEAVSGTELRKAIEKITSPNISTEFTQPVGVSQISDTQLTFDDLSKLASGNRLVQEAMTSNNEELRQAISKVFNEIPVEDWDTEYVNRAVNTVAKELKERKTKKTD